MSESGNPRNEGYLFRLSSTYSCKEKPICRRWFLHVVEWARLLALDRAATSNAARIAMIAIATSNSIKVNPWSAPWLLLMLVGHLAEVNVTPCPTMFSRPICPTTIEGVTWHYRLRRGRH